MGWSRIEGEECFSPVGERSADCRLIPLQLLTGYTCSDFTMGTLVILKCPSTGWSVEGQLNK